MAITILYCIDIPKKAAAAIKTNYVEGWLLCSSPVEEIRVPASSADLITFNYRISRPDLANHFPMFPGNTTAGFTIESLSEGIKLKEKFPVEIFIKDKKDKIKKIETQLDLSPEAIHTIDLAEKQKKADKAFRKTEKKFAKQLQKYPWITVRMDITNKCNLRCIMCHYREEEIYSQPAKVMTPEQLKQSLHEIGPYVKHIMLSCGFEPLMSKHFDAIVRMINENYPHMEIGMCTNGMLMNAKARKSIIESGVTHVLLSMDGATKATLEKIRVGANFEKIIANIMALRDLKQKYKRAFPLMFMDFVLMNSNIHEAPAFVQMCSEMGVELIDFRHLVGNIFFSEHDEMISKSKEKYNYYRVLIIEASKKFNIEVRLPEPFENTAKWEPETIKAPELDDFRAVKPDPQTEEIIDPKPVMVRAGKDSDFDFLSDASCLRPFNEIMIIDQEKILPCSYYHDAMGKIGGNASLYDIFFGENFSKVRQKKLQSGFDHNCLNCPIMLKLLPTEIAK